MLIRGGTPNVEKMITDRSLLKDYKLQ